MSQGRDTREEIRKSLRRIETQIIMESVVTPIDMETVIETIPITDSSDDEAKRR